MAADNSISMEKFTDLKKDMSLFLPPRPVDTYSKDSIRNMAVLFTDIVGSTKYFKMHGDLAGREMLQRHQDLASRPIVEHSGVLVKTLGDSVLAYFLDPKEALKSAIKIQQKSIAHNKVKEPESRIHIKIGIHFGEGIVEEQDIFGNVVNLAAKIVPLAGSDQIYISKEVYDVVHVLSSVLFKPVDILDKKRVPRGLKIYRVFWDERTKFDKTTSLLLYLRPLWRIGTHNFTQLWDSLLKTKDAYWREKTAKKSVLADKSIALVLEEESLSTDLARDVLAFLTKEAGNEYNSAPLPIQIIIDSGHYLRADRLIIEGLEIRWDEIDPGEVYVSSSAYRFLKDKQFLFIDPPFDAKKPKAFYRLVQSGKSQKASSPLFLYQSALTLGDNLPCYYCGARGHMTGDCPSKAMEIDATHALKELGYLSTSQINKLFFNYLAGTNTTHETAEEIKHNRTGSNLLAYHGFYELKLIFQLRFFRAMWDSDDENWDSIKDRKTNRQRGGPIWLAQDCIRASNLARAEEFLNTSMEEHPEDYKVYCAMGFINVERNDYRKAEYYFSQPLDLGYAKAKPQKTLLLFLLSRLYYLNGDYTKAEKKIGDVLSLYPRCPDAIYQNIIFGFRVGRHTKALADLRRLIQEYREYYVNALIDPELAPFNNIIHSQLEILLDQARDQARQGLPKAGMELKKLKRMIGENEKEVVEVQSLSAKMDGLSESGSYSGYLDVIQYSNSIVSMCRRILDSRRRRIFEFLYDLNNRCKKNLALANDFPYRNLVNSVHRQLKLVQTEIDKIKGMIVSDTADVFKKAFNQAEALSTTINDICLELKRLDQIRQIYSFLYTFFKKSLLLQAFNLFIAILLLPLVTHYLNFILPEIKISHQDLWSYQKGVLIVGGILGLFLALLRTVRKLYPE